MSDVTLDDKHDPFMLELFRVELENNTHVLEAGLVTAEKEQSAEKLEPLMRAAHSIKGAARIVNLPEAVTLAHAMEDMLSASQLGKMTLSADHVDALLQGNDFFMSMSRIEPTAIPAWLAERTGEMEETTHLLSALSAGRRALPIKVSTSPATGGEETSASMAAAEKPPARAEAPDRRMAGAPAVIHVPLAAAGDDTPVKETVHHPPQRRAGDNGKTDGILVRVMADNLNRLMALAGEYLVQAQSTKHFYTAWLKMKTVSMELLALLDQQTESSSEPLTTAGKGIQQIKSFGEQIQELSEKQAVEFELFSRRLEHLAHRLYGEVVASRMVPFSDGLHGYSRMVRDVAKELGKKVRFVVQGEATPVDRDILEKLEAPLSHLLRNAVDHGLETPEERISAGKSAEGRLTLEAQHAGGLLHIFVGDDGRGVDPEGLRKKVVEKGYVNDDMAATLSKAELLEFLFLPGFSTASLVTQISGRGVGLDVVYAMAQEVGGSVRIDSEPGAGSRFHLQLPLTLSILRALLVEIQGEPYAMPLSRIDRVLEISRHDLHVVEDKQFCTIDGESVGIVDAHQLFHLTATEESADFWYVVVISDRLSRYGLIVDRFLGERDLVIRPMDPRLGKIPNIGAGAVLQDGAPVLILDAEDLVRSIDNFLKQGRLNKIGLRQDARKPEEKRILVVDDSLTVREVERKLLDGRGYHVTVAVDGVDGWNTLQMADAFDLVISDIDMPRMNGIEMVRKIKSDPQFKGLPVLIVSYKDREEDRLRGLEAGANYYLTKGSFHDERLLAAVQDLIGDP